ncbi:hypothetical protein GCM10008090_06150 [Arenicella chitinivorans]|uniref:Uncharacterized protein n=1 Tax=Arenicella chitinivorans TaxID=1329800 RepID=A0A918VJ44_9GAMM|nr:hypothetical protein GCM10008090_06150 [Arenicella chitinivorans]
MVNLEHGARAAAKAACVQGLYSFTVTLGMTLVLETVFKVMSRYFKARWLIDWTTIATACGAVFSGSWYVNVLAGTPEVFRTVVLGYVIGGVYCILYVRGLAQAHRNLHD